MKFLKLLFIFAIMPMMCLANGILPVTFDNAEYHISHQEDICKYIDATLNSKFIDKQEIALSTEFQECKKQIEIVKSMYKLKKKVIKELSKNATINAKAIKNEEAVIVEKLNGIYKYLHLVYDANSKILAI